jgi:hypothetical protein
MTCRALALTKVSQGIDVKIEQMAEKAKEVHKDSV